MDNNANIITVHYTFSFSFVTKKKKTLKAVTPERLQASFERIRSGHPNGHTKERAEAIDVEIKNLFEQELNSTRTREEYLSVLITKKNTYLKNFRKYSTTGSKPHGMGRRSLLNSCKLNLTAEMRSAASKKQAKGENDMNDMIKALSKEYQQDQCPGRQSREMSGRTARRKSQEVRVKNNLKRNRGQLTTEARVKAICCKKNFCAFVGLLGYCLHWQIRRSRFFLKSFCVIHVCVCYNYFLDVL